MDQQAETGPFDRGKSTLNSDEVCLKVIDKFRYKYFMNYDNVR